MINRVALIGFGEVGQVLAVDLCRAGARVTAWDIAFADSESGPSRAVALYASADAFDFTPFAVSRCSISGASSATTAVKDAQLVISAVTAAQSLEAARSVCRGLAPSCFYLDLNSCSPAHKRAVARVIGVAGGRYVEGAVMSPIHPRGANATMLLGGVHASDLLAAVDGLGFKGASIYSDEIGQAAATKLCRSLMIKGIEALLIESMLAARHYGVEHAVLESLSDLLPLPDWGATAQYMISRSLEHGVRRAEEMVEAAGAVEEAGVQPLMSLAIAQRQAWAGEHSSAISADLAAMLDSLNDARKEPGL